MAHTVAQLANEFRAALKSQPGPAGREKVCKLLKEVLRNVPLKTAELKQIKLLAQDYRPEKTDQRLQSPLTLLLCPSLLGEAARKSRGKADLPVVAGLVKKLVARS